LTAVFIKDGKFETNFFRETQPKETRPTATVARGTAYHRPAARTRSPE